MLEKSSRSSWVDEGMGVVGDGGGAGCKTRGSNGFSFSLAIHAIAHSVIHLVWWGRGNAARNALPRYAGTLFVFVKLTLTRDIFDLFEFLSASSIAGANAEANTDELEEENGAGALPDFPFTYLVLPARILAMLVVSPELMTLERAFRLAVGGVVPSSPASRKWFSNSSAAAALLARLAFFVRRPDILSTA